MVGCFFLGGGGGRTQGLYKQYHTACICPLMDCANTLTLCIHFHSLCKPSQSLYGLYTAPMTFQIALAAFTTLSLPLQSFFSLLWKGLETELGYFLFSVIFLFCEGFRKEFRTFFSPVNFLFREGFGTEFREFISVSEWFEREFRAFVFR